MLLYESWLDLFKVILELIIGLALCMWAALTFPGKFLSIHPDSDENRFVIMFLSNSLFCISVNQSEFMLSSECFYYWIFLCSYFVELGVELLRVL
jgi:hypothetical protein